MPRRKAEVITFKVDPSLADAMRGVPNRSHFIRQAILSALENACPLCGGTGVLTPDQQRHWEGFLGTTHRLETCADCEARHLVCQAAPACEDASPHETEPAE
jgi:hypothetical protein